MNNCATPTRVLVVSATLPLPQPRRHNWGAVEEPDLAVVAREPSALGPVGLAVLGSQRGGVPRRGRPRTRVHRS
jgi:hypothetical protein